MPDTQLAGVAQNKVAILSLMTQRWHNTKKYTRSLRLALSPLPSLCKLCIPNAIPTRLPFLAFLPGHLTYPTARQGQSRVVSRKAARTEGGEINLDTNGLMYGEDTLLVQMTRMHECTNMQVRTHVRAHTCMSM